MRHEPHMDHSSFTPYRLYLFIYLYSKVNYNTNEIVEQTK